MTERGKWQGMWTIVMFNWPIYLAAVVVLVIATCLIFGTDHLPVRILSVLAASGSVYFLVGSLGVSHWVYDRSDLYRWHWLTRAMHGAETHRMIFCHSGFDESSGEMKERFCGTQWVVLDHYDELRMTEASIRRARDTHPPTPGTLAAPHDRWPVVSETTDVVMGLLAIHELRSEKERVAWFTEAGRCLRPGGRVILAEHVRDLANFAAFGPGFIHFHSVASWRKCWRQAGLQDLDEFRMTPWVRIFVISKP